MKSLESRNKGSALGLHWVPALAAVVGRRSRGRAEAFPPEQLQIKINSDNGNNDFSLLFLHSHS